MKLIFLSILVLSLKQIAFGQINKSYFVYDSSKSYWENYSSGFIDTFNNSGSKFRVRLADTVNYPKFVLEKFQSVWLPIDTFTYPKYGYWYKKGQTIYNSDYNLDGYNDFIVDYKWYDLVYLFNPDKRTYVKCGFFEYGYDTLKVISKNNNLFYDKWGYKYDDTWSYLFTIKNYKRINLGVIAFGTYNSDDDTIVKPAFISISKIVNDTTELLKEKLPKNYFDSFDTESYWKRNWKYFYPNNKSIPNINFPKLYVPVNLENNYSQQKYLQ